MTTDLKKRDEPGVAADLSDAPEELRANAEQASTALAQKDFADLDIEIIVLLDCSRSMAKMFADGRVQRLTDWVTGYGLATDADGEVPLIPFDDEVRDPIPLTAKNATGIVASRIYGSPNTLFPTADDMGSTNLGEALAKAREIIEQTGRFTEVVVIGDGDPNGPGDPERSTQETIRIGELGGFVKFVALKMVNWLRTVDELEKTQPNARKYDNVHAVEVPDPGKIEAQQFYQLMVQGLDQHIKGASDNGYLNR